MDYESRAPMGNLRIFDLYSKEIDETFRIFVAQCGENPQAVLFAPDANGSFGLVVDTIRLMQLPALAPSLLVVGIGYSAAKTLSDTTVPRARDLTPTRSKLFSNSGGADAFLRFIATDLRNKLTELFENLPVESIYFGHSLGGLLGVHDLLRENRTFDSYIISSPSLWWNRNIMFQVEESRALTNTDLKASAFFGIGGLETDPGRRLEAVNLPDSNPAKPPEFFLDMVEELDRFVAVLRSRAYPSLRMHHTTIPGEFHATVSGISLNRGLRFLFNHPSALTDLSLL